MKQKGGLRDRWLLVCLLLCVAAAAAAILPVVFSDSGRFLLREDFNDETIPFAMAANRALRLSSGGPYVWNLDLGTPLVHGFGYFCLGSPFYWLSLLFPATWFMYLTGPLLILKYAVAGMTAYLYLRRFVRDPKAAVLGALLYAFSGYQTVNLFFYLFHDVAAFFPLLLLGMERSVTDGKRDLFPFAVFLSALTNYYMFAAEVIFLFLYFLFRWGERDIRRMLRRIWEFLYTGALGVGMAAVLFLPSALYAMGNPGHEHHVGLFRLFFAPDRFLLILKGILFLPEAMHENSAAIVGAWDSTSCYLPLTGLVLVFAYMLRRRDRLTAFLAFLFAISLLPVTNAVFTFFTQIVYYRWWFMLILMMAVAACRVVEDPEGYPLVRGCLLHAFLLAVWMVVLYLMPPDENGEGLIYDPQRFLIYAGLTLCGIILWPVILRMKKRRMTAVFLGVLVISVLTMSLVISNYRYGNDENHYMEQYAVAQTLTVRDPLYRYRLSRNVLTLTGEAAGLNSYTSTASNAIIRFDQLFDHKIRILRLDKQSIPGLAELLAGRYVVSEEGEVSEADACPMGFRIGRVIFADELMKLPVQQRGEAMLYAPAVDPSDPQTAQWIDEGLVECTGAQEVAEVLSKQPEEQWIREMTAAHRGEAVSEFQRNGKGFSFATDDDADGIFWFSVPADDGWTAAIDGEKVPIADAHGMMMIRIPAGSHQVRFVYHTPGLAAGTVLSLLCWGIWGICLYCTKRRFALR